jgi:colanic acid biosynthesis glycosyl transferase WcaI
MVAKIFEKRLTRNEAIYFPNWVDTRLVNPDKNEINYRNLWNIDENAFVLLYSGTLGKKQGLEIICNVASALKDYSDIVFLIVGEGIGKDNLIEMVQKARNVNIIFKPLQPVETLPCLLNCADVHLIIQKKSFADAVLPSKLITILAAGGVALITADPNTELSNLVRDNPNLAIIVEPENANVIINKILEIRSDEKLRAQIKSVARDFAVKNLDKESVLAGFEKQIVRVVNKDIQ